jgi:hypothetical protein
LTENTLPNDQSGFDNNVSINLFISNLNRSDFLQTNIDLPILSHSPNQCDSTCSTATLSSQLSATSAEESDDESNVLEFNDQFDIIEDQYTEKNNDAEYRSLLLAITTMYFAANLTRDSTELLTTLIQLITKCKMPKSFKTIVNHLIEHEFPIEKKFYCFKCDKYFDKTRKETQCCGER